MKCTAVQAVSNLCSVYKWIRCPFYRRPCRCWATAAVSAVAAACRPHNHVAVNLCIALIDCMRGTCASDRYEFGGKDEENGFTFFDANRNGHRQVVHARWIGDGHWLIPIKMLKRKPHTDRGKKTIRRIGHSFKTLAVFVKCIHRMSSTIWEWVWGDQHRIETNDQKQG